MEKQRYCWGVKSESRLRMSSSASLTLLREQLPLWLRRQPLPPSLLPPRRPRTPVPLQSQRPASETVAGSCGNLRLSDPRESPAALSRCWASSLAALGSEGALGPVQPLSCFCHPAGCRSPSQSRPRFSWPGSGPCHGRDRPHSFCKPLAAKAAFLPRPPAHTHSPYLQREGLVRLFLHVVCEYSQQSFALVFLIQSLENKAQGGRSGSS